MIAARPSPRLAFTAALLLAFGPVLALSPALPTPAAHAQSGPRDAGAEQFVQTEAQRALRILGDQSDTDKIREFRAFTDQVADVPTITHFVLGKYNRSISPDQYQRFAAAFRDYASKVYESRLDDYHGQTLKVTGSTIRKPGDVIVTSLVVSGQAQPTPVRWRVINGPAGWKVDDVEVGGVWLAITEQQDFVSTIDNAHGDIGVLIAQLEKRNGEARERAR